MNKNLDERLKQLLKDLQQELTEENVPEVERLPMQDVVNSLIRLLEENK